MQNRSTHLLLTKHLAQPVRHCKNNTHIKWGKGHRLWSSKTSSHGNWSDAKYENITLWIMKIYYQTLFWLGKLIIKLNRIKLNIVSRQANSKTIGKRKQKPNIIYDNTQQKNNGWGQWIEKSNLWEPKHLYWLPRQTLKNKIYMVNHIHMKKKNVTLD